MSVLCVDASLQGGGVVYKKEDPDRVLELTEGSDCERTRWICKTPWRVAIRHEWRFKAHIHVLEGEALILGLRWLIKNTENHGKRC